MSNLASIDPIADMLTRIRNASAIRKSEVNLPHSGVKESIARLLKDNNYIDAVRTENKDGIKTLTIVINDTQGSSRITEITRLSTPGRRLYVRASEIKKLKRGRGIIIISTSKGLMTNLNAEAQGIGGELICKVY
ncbi:MAG: 30S ribosomal protein S8 [Candidatus Saccharimonadales bacterium]